MIRLPRSSSGPSGVIPTSSYNHRTLSERSTPRTPEGSWRLRFRFFTASMAFTGITAARLPLLPPSRAGPLTTLQASLHAADRPVAPPKKGYRHWALTRTASNPSRQSATEPPNSYPDRTHTGKRRRARTKDHPFTRSPPVPLGAKKIEVNADTVYVGLRDERSRSMRGAFR